MVLNSTNASIDVNPRSCKSCACVFFWVFLCMVLASKRFPRLGCQLCQALLWWHKVMHEQITISDLRVESLKHSSFGTMRYMKS